MKKKKNKILLKKMYLFEKDYIKCYFWKSRNLKLVNIISEGRMVCNNISTSKESK